MKLTEYEWHRGPQAGDGEGDGDGDGDGEGDGEGDGDGDGEGERECWADGGEGWKAYLL